MIHYRPATPNDWEAIAQLHTKSWQISYRGILSDQYLDHDIIEERRKVWKERYENPAGNMHVILAYDGEELCGLNGLFANHDEQWGTLLDNLHVLPRWRGLGIGAELLIKGAEWSYQRDPKAMYYLWVFEGNMGARGFYERMGGEHTETSLYQNQDGGQAKVMRFVWRDVKGLIERKHGRKWD